MGGVNVSGKSVLGRGLSALFEPEPSASVLPIKKGMGSGGAPTVLMIHVKNIAPGDTQPRKEFNDVTLVELSQSIMRNGLIQPIVVQKVEPEFPNGASEAIEYRILAGERRWRACCYLGWTEIPAMVVQATPEEALSLSLIENIQREDISPLEEAEAYKRLIEEVGYTQEALANRVGKSRSHIANLLRLNGLGETLKKLLQTNQLSVGHVRALLTVDNNEEIACQVVKKGLNVRQTEKLIYKLKIKDKESRSEGESPSAVPQKKTNIQARSQNILSKPQEIFALEQDMGYRFAREVDIGMDPETLEGTFTFRFKGMADLDELLNTLTLVSESGETACGRSESPL